MTIGIFDSGKGGYFVASRLQKLLPTYEFKVVDDHKHVPYGSRSQREIFDLTNTTIQPLLAVTSTIVLACNTATAAAIDELRSLYPQHTFIGFEPMIKPLSNLTEHGIVLATPATLASARYKALKAAYASTLIIDEPNTMDWAEKIENDRINEIDFTQLDGFVETGGDTISLSCTHYLVLEDLLHQRYSSCRILEPTHAIAERIRAIL